MSPKRPVDFQAEMLSLAQDRVPIDTVISLWRTRLPAQIQIMVLNCKEETELLKSADMAHDVLQQSHNINALNTHSSASVVPDEGVAQILATIREYTTTVDKNDAHAQALKTSATLRLQDAGKLVQPAATETDSRTGITTRLRVKDKLSDEVFLIDTGADISVIPKPKIWRGVPAQFKLYTINGSTIDVFGVARPN